MKKQTTKTVKFVTDDGREFDSAGKAKVYETLAPEFPHSDGVKSEPEAVEDAVNSLTLEKVNALLDALRELRKELKAGVKTETPATA